MTSFHINGRAMTVDAEDDTPLLWVIRDVIGLTGTKFGCGIGMCGACTVHVGGRPTRSCTTLLANVAGAKVTTIVGYCQSGQIMQAASLSVSCKAERWWLPTARNYWSRTRASCHFPDRKNECAANAGDKLSLRKIRRARWFAPPQHRSIYQQDANRGDDTSYCVWRG